MYSPGDSVYRHCEAINRCNQRGGRMLSVTDLIDTDTLSADVAAYCLAAIGAGASFMVGAQPGGAGKTTLMGALLNLVPCDLQLRTATSGPLVHRALSEDLPHSCFVCHEIGDGPYEGYLWGEALRAYMALAAKGHMLATNLHADTFEQARDQLCRQNAVSGSAFLRLNLILFITVKPEGATLKRTVDEIWESDGVHEHCPIMGPRVRLPLQDASRLVTPESFGAARQALEELLACGARTLEEVRGFLLDRSPCSTSQALSESPETDDPHQEERP